MEKRPDPFANIRSMVGQIDQALAHCDFCYATNPAWTYPCVDFRIKDAMFELDWGSTGGWAACQRCRNLIDKHDIDGLLDYRHKAAQEVELYLNSNREQRAILQQKTRLMYEGFFKHRHGEPIPFVASKVDLTTDVITVEQRPVLSRKEQDEMRREEMRRQRGR